MSTALQAGKKPHTEANPHPFPLLPSRAFQTTSPPLPAPAASAQSQGVSLALVTAALKEVLGG